jgi:sterol desaturase/sphingolipid hydroxylase (fatty acid hydroxylase superfamily)
MAVLTIFWSSGHFYFVHRLLHWPPLYRVAHALHHKNNSPQP